MARRWRGIISQANVQVPETPPGPGEEAPTPRIFELFTWREPPFTLRAVFSDTYAHQQAAPVARCDRVWADGDDVWAEGVFSSVADGVKAETLVDEQIMNAVSVDPSDYAYLEEWIDPETQEIVPEERLNELWAEAMDAIDKSDEETYVEIVTYLDSLYIRLRFTRYEIGGATLTAIQAITRAHIELVPEDEEGGTVAASAVPTGADLAAAQEVILDPIVSTAVLPIPNASRESAAARLARLHPTAARRAAVQASGPAVRPASWYQRQTLDVETPWTITDEGRIAGHLTVWEKPDGTPNCHRSLTGTCIAPFRQDDFSEYHCGEAALDDGSRMRIGVITYADLHATPGGQLSIRQLQQLMEDTGVQLGTMRLYADEFGIQASGATHADVTPEQVARALAGTPSGDWRMVAGSYRLFGVHVVNTGGYPTREGYDGHQRAVMAAMLPPAGTVRMALPGADPHACGGACGASEGQACSCHDLTAADLATLADLDRAQQSRRSLTRR